MILCGPDVVGFSDNVAWLRAVGGCWFGYSCARDVGLWFICLSVACSRAVGLSCFFVCVGFGCGCLVLFIRCFCLGLMPLSLCFRGGAVRFSFFMLALFGFVCILGWWALPVWL